MEWARGREREESEGEGERVRERGREGERERGREGERERGREGERERGREGEKREEGEALTCTKNVSCLTQTLNPKPQLRGTHVYQQCLMSRFHTLAAAKQNTAGGERRE
jgi:hypothetical protein